MALQAPEGSYELRWERRNGLLSFSPSRTTHLTLADSWLIYNVGDRLQVQHFPKAQERLLGAKEDGGLLEDKAEERVKEILFMPQGVPTCHDHCSGMGGGDLVVGTSTGDVFLLSLEEQWKETSSRPVGGTHFVPDASVSGGRKCMDISWSPKRDGSFVVAHQDGSLHLFHKRRSSTKDLQALDIKGEGSPIANPTRQSTVEQASHMDRIQVCAASINAICFSPQGELLAAACGDGKLRVWDLERRQLLYGFSSFYGAFLCCGWSGDGQYIAAGGEDDTICLYSVAEQTTVVWGEGHESFVSGIAFDNWFKSPEALSAAGELGEVKTYRFATAGQDTQVCLWELQVEGGDQPMDAKLEPLDQRVIIQPSPRRSDMCFLVPLCCSSLHSEPLSDLRFTEDAMVTACHSGQVRIWDRPR